MKSIRTLPSSKKRTTLPTLLLLLALLFSALPAAAIAAPAALPLAQDEQEPVYFVSGTLRAASSPGRVITLTLNPDDTATLLTDYLNDDEPPLDEGTWTSDEASQTLTVTFTGNQFGDFDEAQVYVFDVAEDGTLTLNADADESTVNYGAEGLTLYFSEDGSQPDVAAESVSPADPAGVYISNILPAADTAGQVVLMILYADGAIQAETYYLNQEPPISETGAWTLTSPSEVQVTITGTTEEEYTEPQELVFTYNGFSLTYLALTLNRVIEQAQGAAPVAYYLTDVLPAASSPGLQMGLVLYDDGSATMVNDYQNGEDPIVEIGSWIANEDGTLTVTLTGRPDAIYDEPDVITFALEGDELISTEWDEAIYGSAGLTLTEQSLDDIPVAEEESLSTTEEVTTTTTLTETEPVTATEEVTSTEDVTATEDLSALLSDQLANFQTPIGAQSVFVSGFLPSASTPGRVVALILYTDGTTEMLTDYLTGDAPYSEVGTWEEDADGAIEVSLTGPASGQAYDTPVDIVFAPTDTGIEAVEYDQSVYGSEGLTLNEVAE